MSDSTSTLIGSIFNWEDTSLEQLFHSGPAIKVKLLAAANFYFIHSINFKVVSLIVTIAMVALAIYFAVVTNWLGLRINQISHIFGKIEVDKRRAIKGWIRIQKYLKIGDEAHLKLAVIEADNILDEILKITGFKGETLGDRLKNFTPAQIPNINEIWSAHKIRNRLVHEPDYNLDYQSAKQIIDAYEKTFQELGLLD